MIDEVSQRGGGTEKNPKIVEQKSRIRKIGEQISKKVGRRSNYRKTRNSGGYNCDKDLV